jgi:hypothetical protein
MQDTSLRESLTDKQWDRIFYGCPGAWAGNKPKPHSHGSIVIDGRNILAAVPCPVRQGSFAGDLVFRRRDHPRNRSPLLIEELAIVKTRQGGK